MKSASGISTHDGSELPQDGTGGRRKQPLVSPCSKPLDWLYNFSAFLSRLVAVCAGAAENPSPAVPERDSRRRAELAVLQRDDAVEAVGEFEVVRSDQRGQALG